MVDRDCSSAVTSNDADWLKLKDLSGVQVRLSGVLNAQRPAYAVPVASGHSCVGDSTHFMRNHPNDLEDEKVQQGDKENAEDEDKPFKLQLIYQRLLPDVHQENRCQ